MVFSWVWELAGVMVQAATAVITNNHKKAFQFLNLPRILLLLFLARANVIPAKAGIHLAPEVDSRSLPPRRRGVGMTGKIEFFT
ncbi:MAG: hypothetical protein IPM53_07510 [Anaerolineaceae bacterium]|nr:hypothetical protein [Anaerolineaceae bacterium]